MNPIERLRSLLQPDASPLEVIELCEETLVRLPRWIDLQLHVCQALEKVNARAARDAIGAAVCGLIAQQPALLEERLPDGSRATTELTVSWLRAEQLRLSGPLPAPVPSELTLHQGLGRLAERSGQLRARRERFMTRLDMASLCLERGRADLARELLEELMEEAERHRLAEWEPALLGLVLGLLTQVAQVPMAGLGAEERRRLFARLCRFDPAAAERVFFEQR